ncbi:MAG: hypothetical protein JO307_20635 [Bryobacterales bacterium]|nr:hypothetical protein [Bryobacterales bacterium]MBV9396428.1 hypothetical protein [Bryobacterales bacterium]
MGRGACVPHPISLAVFEWRKTYSNTGPPSEQFYARMSQAEGNYFPALPPKPPWGPLLNGFVQNPGPDCRNLLPAPLDAGTIMAWVTGQATISTPLGPGGEISVSLPSGTVGAGPHTLSTVGGKDVGPFSSTVAIPGPIQVTSQFPPGTTLSCNKPLTVSWTGGDDQSAVDVKVRTFAGGFEMYMEAILSGSAGTYTFTPPGFALNDFLVDCPASAEIDVTQTPAALMTFGADGLMLGARHAWKYEYQFTGLQMSSR